MAQSGEHLYAAIDLKSFYASVECRERGLDPLTTNLVVADESRTEKTICLAVSPTLKAYGIPGRARLFEVVEKTREVNAQRLRAAPGRRFAGESFRDPELRGDASLKLSYITAMPRMALYMQYSARIYEIYLRTIAPEDIHVYSIDEVFLDVSRYLDTYKTTARALVMRMMHEVLAETGITATGGIGTNLYLAKVAMDISAKHMQADKDGVRIAMLDESTYRQTLWDHRPLTDFWRVGRGYAKKLEENGLHTMGDIARCSLGKPNEAHSEDLLYRLFGVNAELLIDHAWGWEPCTLADIKAYRPQAKSVGSGQVLQEPYSFEKGRLIVREMTDLLVLDLVDKHLVTDQMVLYVGYDIESLKDPARRSRYDGPIETDRYGRQVPKAAHGSVNLDGYTSSTKRIMEAVLGLYDRIVNSDLLVRRVSVTANHAADEAEALRAQQEAQSTEQLDLFTDYREKDEQQQADAAALAREKRMQEAMLTIKKKFGKNAILKGTNLEEGAMTVERNRQIGGHKA